MTTQKKILSIIVIAGLVIGLGVSAFIIYAPSNQTSEASSLYAKYLDQMDKQPSQTINEARQENTYTDSSGFSFRYFSDISVSDITPSDPVYYTALLLKKGVSSMKVDIKDTGYTTVDSWYAREGSGRKLVGAVSLGGISAQQYTDAENLYTVAIDQGVLYSMQSPRDAEYWDDVHDLFVESFAFSNGESTSNSVKPTSVPNSSGVIYLDEEVIE